MKTFIIYNPQDELSTNLANETAKSCRDYGLDPMLFPGTFGKDIERKIKEYNLKPSSLVPGFTPGTKGCFISHFELWKKCITDGAIPYLILEHDVVMKNSLPENIMSLFDEVLNLDYCGSKQKNEEEYHSCTSYNGPIEIVSPFNNKPMLLDSWKTAKSNNIPGAYAYIIKPSAAEKLVKVAESFGFLPADVHINNVHVDLKSIRPSIFRICDFMSDRKNRVKFSSTKGYGYGNA